MRFMPEGPIVSMMRPGFWQQDGKEARRGVKLSRGLSWLTAPLIRSPSRSGSDMIVKSIRLSPSTTRGWGQYWR
jgi:hypothetical protein